ncbi:hypothetical protein LguiB_028409 [Lonicera macranthoides]
MAFGSSLEDDKDVCGGCRVWYGFGDVMKVINSWIWIGFGSDEIGNGLMDDGGRYEYVYRETVDVYRL